MGWHDSFQGFDNLGLSLCSFEQIVVLGSGGCIHGWAPLGPETVGQAVSAGLKKIKSSREMRVMPLRRHLTNPKRDFCAANQKMRRIPSGPWCRFSSKGSGRAGSGYWH